MGRARRYEDPCGIARALDRLGERWALLVVRELWLGPRRFGELRAGLRGVSPNVLTQRLEELIADGIVEREAERYALTARGQELEELLLTLGRWGSQAPILGASGDLSAAALFLALRTTYQPIDHDLEIEVFIGTEPYRLRLDAKTLRITREAAKHPAATLTTDVSTLRRLCFGDVALEDAAATIEGKPRAAARFLASFRRPTISE